MTVHVQERQRADVAEDRRDRVRLALGAIAVLLLGLLTWSVFSARNDAEQAVTEKQSLAQQVTAACGAGGAAERELESVGACDSAATAAVGAPAESQPVIQVATDQQVRTAVSDYLQDHPPADGRAPTDAEVEAAVSRVCATIGCRGAAGDAGADGQTGPAGADVTDDQVAAQVAEYCASNNGCLPTQDEINEAVRIYCSATPSPCVGPEGAQGVQGEPGPVLPEYRLTDHLTGVTRLCVLQPAEDAADPPHYECTRE